MASSQTLVAILPCNNLDRAEAFYRRLGFARADEAAQDDYRMLTDGQGGQLHLRQAEAGWLVPGSNPFGLYLYTQKVEALAAAFAGEVIGAGPEHKPWGMYEFAVSDPDETLVRVGWPSRLLDPG